MAAEKSITNERGPLYSFRRILPPGLGRVSTLIFNNTMRFVPFSIKYRWIGKSLRTNRAPYRSLQPDDTIVQVGSARDILHSGRSRAVNLAMFIPHGRLVVIEADTENQKALQKYIDQYNLTNVTLVSSGAWNKKTRLEFLSNPNHPASNLIREAQEVLIDECDESIYEKYEIEVDSIDAILKRLGLGVPKLISITTNGSEPKILEGCKEAIAAGTKYISLAPTGRDYVQMTEALGYRYVAEDDRGFFFERRDAA